MTHRSFRILRLVQASALFTSLACGSARAVDDPERARLVTEDIPRFWQAFDARAKLGTATALETLYLKPGTRGLEDWKRLRLKDAATMAKTVDSAAVYYESARASTLRIAEQEPRIRAMFRKLDELYDDAVFPDVYFVIGRLSSGGTPSDAGLLIGAEMYGRTDDPVVGRMGAWLSAVLRPVEDVPGIVAHELVHYQQRSPGRSLISRAVNEGSADFIGEMVSGININAHVHAWVFAEEGRERALWEEFRTRMRRNDDTGWFTTDDAAKRPKDLAYFMGYRIAQAYYERAADKKAAIRDILRVKDAEAFLERSGYAERFR
jgi:hypothetical protein